MPLLHSPSGTLSSQLSALYINAFFDHFQCFCDDEGSESQLLVPLLSSCDKMYPKESEEEVLYSAPTKDLESFYSPLGEHDLKDLPSFAYQISQGMVIMNAVECTLDQAEDMTCSNYCCFEGYAPYC